MSAVGHDPVDVLTPAQRRLLRIISDHPLLNWRGLGRVAYPNTRHPGTSLRTNLDALIRAGLIVETFDGNQSRYHVRGSLPVPMVPLLIHFAHPRRAALLRLLLEQGSVRHREARRALGVADSTLWYHARGLVNAGVVQRTLTETHIETRYSLAEPERVRAAVDLWDRLHEPKPEVPA